MSILLHCRIQHSQGVDRQYDHQISTVRSILGSLVGFTASWMLHDACTFKRAEIFACLENVGYV